MTSLITLATRKVIGELGAGLSYEDDVLPAFAAADIELIEAKVKVEVTPDFKFVSVPMTRDHVSETLNALDLEDPLVAHQVLRFTQRLARVFNATSGANLGILSRLAYALGDDAQRIKAMTWPFVESPYDGIEQRPGGNVSKVSIDKAAIAKMMRDIQKEFDKHPIRVPVNAEAPEITAGGTTNVYHGPVIMGDANNAQLAWGNNTVHQTQNATEQIAPGYEAIAQAVAKTLEGLAQVGLDDDDRQEAEAIATEVLEEVTRTEPNGGKIKRALMALRGFLAPIATGASVGAAEGAHEWARTAIEHLGVPF